MTATIILGAAFCGGVLLLSLRKLEDRKYQRFVLWAGLLFLAALALRLILAYTSEGFSLDLGTFKAWGVSVDKLGFHQIYEESSFLDYPPGYLYVLRLTEKLRKLFGWTVEGQIYTTVIKLPSILTDLACGWVLLWLGRKKLGDLPGLLLSAAYLFCPAVFVNSAQWGQVDSFCTAILLASVLLLYAEKYVPSGLLYGLSIICKPQMLVFAPLYIFFTVKRKKWLGLGLGVGCALLAILAVAAPFTKNLDFTWLIGKYRDTMDYYNYYTVNACNFWAFLGWNWRGLPEGAASTLLTALAPVLATGLCGALMFCSKRKDAVLAAPPVLMGVMYILGVKMHERYLFPAFLFLLLAYAFTRDRRQLRAFAFITGANYINVSYVLWLFREKGNSYDPNAAASRWIALLQMAALCYLLWVNYSVYIRGDIRQPGGNPPAKAKASAGKSKKRKQAAAETPLAASPSGSGRVMARVDWIVMGAVTLLYGAVGFWHLGGTQMPLTAWTPQEGESVVLMADKTCHTLYYLPGLTPDANHYAARTGSSMRVETSEDGINWTDCGDTNNGYVFAWQAKWLETPGRYVRLTALDGSVTVNEAALLPAGATAFPALTLEGADAGALTDEQEKVPVYKSYEVSSYFDEIYHARTAYEHILGLEPYENTHPPLGKQIIALGIRIFGMNPFGWRFMGTLFGVLMLPVLYHLCKQLFGKTWLCAGAVYLFAFDFMHFTQTRIATIDTYAVFFILLMYDAMVWFMRQDILKTDIKKLLIPLGLSGVFMGLGVASKWTAAYGAVGLAVLFFAKLAGACVYESRGRRSLGPVLRRCGVLCAWCCLLFIAIPFGIYFCAFLPMTTLPHNVQDIFGKFINYQTTMFNYHSTLVAEHSYASPWYEWPIDMRPIWFFGGDDVNAQGQYSTISSMGNPLLWWACIPAILYAAYRWLKDRNRTCGVALAGFLAVYMPWVLVPRLTFIYHYFTAVPFLVIALMAAFQRLSEDSPWAGRVLWRREISPALTLRIELAPALLAVFAVLCTILFIIYFPVISGLPTTREHVQSLAFIESWFFG